MRRETDVPPIVRVITLLPDKVFDVV